MRKAIIIIILVLFSFLFSALFLKIISDEDDWIPDGKGGWAKHGVPAGPPPDYPSPIGNRNTSVLQMFATLLVIGSLLSSLSVFLYLKLSKVSQKKE